MIGNSKSTLSLSGGDFGQTFEISAIKNFLLLDAHLLLYKQEKFVKSVVN